MEQKEDMKINFIDRIKGDKVLLIIYLCLTMFSVLTLFSSTSLLVNAKTNRVDMFLEQVIFVMVGILIVFACYKLIRIKKLRLVSQLLFGISFLLLFFLVVVHLKIPKVIEAQNINEAWRSYKVFGKLQIHVFEVVKVFMVLYLSWAVQAWYDKWGDGAYEQDRDEGLPESYSEFRMTEYLADRYEKLEFLDSQKWEEMIYIFFPIGIICMMILPGSNSSTVFIGFVMIVTVLIGGFSLWSTLKMGLACAVVIGACFFINLESNGKVFSFLRAREIITRVTDVKKDFDTDYILKSDSLRNKQISRKAFTKFIDKNRQVQGAKIAVHDGRDMKGPGGSTQKYSVASIFGDFMYSFIIEEYGIIGGILILVLFGSLLSRGIYIALNCQGVFSRTLVAGLSMLISGQALMHIMVNVRLGPMTGQTLPLISDGKTAFLMFSLAFGILLAISRIASKNIEDADRERAEMIEDEEYEEASEDNMEYELPEKNDSYEETEGYN